MSTWVAARSHVRLKWVLLYLLATATTAMAADAGERVSVVPTFESAGFYINAVGEGTHVDVAYRKLGSEEWKKALAPIYDADRLQSRGSIVGLDENTAYEIQVTLRADGASGEVLETSFATWDPEPRIARVVSIDEVYTEGQLLIYQWIGEEDGWIKIVGDGTTVIDGGYLVEETVLVASSRYVILENLIIRGGRRHGMHITNSEHIRVINCDIAGYGRRGTQDPKTGLYHDEHGERINYDAGIKLWSSGNLVLERNYIHDPRNTANPWTGPTWDWTHPAGPTAVHVGSKGSIVMRYNDIVGSDDHRWNDGVEGVSNKSPDGSFYRDSDIYGNLFLYGNDDSVELDGGQMNVRFYGNRVEGFRSGVSTVPNKLGPCYIFRNLMTHLGDEMGVVGSAVKSGDDSPGRQLIFHNTMSATGNTERGFRRLINLTTRNNIFIDFESGGYASNNPPGLAGNDFDYDLMGSTATPDGKGVLDAVSGWEANGILGLPDFEDERHGDFRLKPTSLGVDAGEVIPNFSDSYHGAGPDMGAFEVGEQRLMPWRPIDAELDKQRLTVWSGIPKTVTLHIGKLKGGSQAFSIKKNDCFDWLKVEPASGVLSSNSAATFVVTVQPENMKRPLEKGAFLIKLDDGYSIPVVVRGTSASWNIDDKPIGYVRYRVSPGTAAALYLHAVSPSGEEVRTYLATSPAILPALTLPRVGEYGLIDDGEWHDLFFDAHLIREIYPDTKMLFQPAMETLTKSVSEPPELDEVASLSEEMLIEEAWAERLQARQRWHPNVLVSHKNQILSGQVPVDVSVVRYEDVAMREFVLELGGRLVSRGNDAPPAGSYSIDTYQFEDGTYDLVLKVTDEVGQSSTQSHTFTIRNRTRLTDTLEPPIESAWFGVFDRSKTAYQSEGWQYTDTPAGLFMDSGREARKADTAEYLVWDTPFLREFAVTIYAQGEDVTNSIDLAASPDGEKWLNLQYDVDVVESSADGWHKLVLTGTGPANIETRQFRVTFHDYSPTEGLQIGHAVFDIRK